jgi:hypothetical protein
MTANQLTLPIQATRGRSLKLAIPVFLLGMVILGIIYPYTLSPQDTQYGQYGEYYFIPTAINIVLFISGYLLLLKRMKPANISISRTSVTIEPMPILGFKCGKSASLNLSDFTGVDLVKKPKQGNTVVLRSKDSKNDIQLDTPKNTKPQEYAQQLRASLNLKGKV